MQLSHYLFVVPAMLYIVLTTIYPIASNLRMSFYDVTVTTFLSNNAPFIGLGNYRTVLSDPAFQYALRLSLLFTGGSLLFQFTIGFALAWLFSRPFPGNGLFRALLLGQFFRFGEASATAILLLVVLTVVAVGYLWLSRREEVA